MSRVSINRFAGDFGDTMQFTLLEDDETPTDITGATAVAMHVRREREEAVFLNVSMTIIDAPTGRVDYTVVSGNFPEAGIFYIQAQVTLPTQVITYNVAILTVQPQIV